MIKLVVFPLMLSSLFACVRYSTTDEGGYRVRRPEVFKYNKPKYKQCDKSLIDINCVYIMKSKFDIWKKPNWQTEEDILLRFFSGGQVLFIFIDSFPSAETVNNPNIGNQGYFTIEGNKIKIDRFSDLNYGQTEKYYGRIQSNGDILFYENTPETYLSIYHLLEKKSEKTRYSIWEKTKIDGFKHYSPRW